MKKDSGKVNWSQFSESIEKVLGEDFWSEMQHVIPKRGPAYDMYEMNNGMCIVLELPDLRSAEDIRIKQNGTDLLVQGSIPYRYPVEKDKLIHSERLVGKFKRIIPISFHYLPSDVTTRYENGLLKIFIQRPEREEEIIVHIPSEEKIQQPD